MHYGTQYTRIADMRPRTTGGINVIGQIGGSDSFREFLTFGTSKKEEDELVGDVQIFDNSGSVLLRVTRKAAESLGLYDNEDNEMSSKSVFLIKKIVVNVVNGHLVLETTTHTQIDRARVSRPTSLEGSAVCTNDVSLIDYTELEQHGWLAN